MDGKEEIRKQLEKDVLLRKFLFVVSLFSVRETWPRAHMGEMGQWKGMDEDKGNKEGNMDRIFEKVRRSVDRKSVV